MAIKNVVLKTPVTTTLRDLFDSQAQKNLEMSSALALALTVTAASVHATATAAVATPVAAAATAVAATAVQNMTRHELARALKQARADLDFHTKRRNRDESEFRRCYAQSLRLDRAIIKLSRTNLNHPNITLLRQESDQFKGRCHYLGDEHVQRLNQELQEMAEHIEEIEAIENSWKSPVTGDLQVMVRLLSGDVLSVQVDASLPVARFADLFAIQHHYAPSATDRMVFLLSDSKEEESKEDELDIFWSPELRHEGKTMGELEGHLNLIIRPLVDREMPDRLTLLRKILHTHDLRYRFSDDELVSLYSTWILTWLPPVTTNMYIKMRAFVDAHPDVFPPLTPEEKEKRDHDVDVEEFRTWRRGLARYYSVHHLQRIGHVDLVASAFIQGYLRTTGDVPMSPLQMQHLLNYFTVPQLYEAGMTHGMVSRGYHQCRFVLEWDHYVALAEAAE